jgi:hypothetical protein
MNAMLAKMQTTPAIFPEVPFSGDGLANWNAAGRESLDPKDDQGDSDYGQG